MGIELGRKPYAILALAWAVGGCGEAVPEVHSNVSPLTAIKPRPMYLEVPEEQLTISGAVDTLVGQPRHGPYLYAGPGQPPLPIYLNRNGGTYSPGPDDSRQNTSIVPNSVSTISAFGGSTSQWNTVVACVTEMFAPFNAVIVTTEPPSGEYIEAVIGGYPQELGLPNGVGGVAPIDSSRCRIIPNAVVYAFAGVYGNQMQDVCETAAQEIAHALSLDHEFYCPDPMTYLSGCGDKSFRDHAAQCGEYSARACNCGRPSQNSVQVITEKLGAFNGQPPPPPPNDPVPPVVSITAPGDGDTFPDNSTVTVTVNATDNLAIASTELVWQFTNATFPCPYTGSGGSVTCTRSGNVSTWQIRVGQGDRTFYARATDTAGNQVQSPPRTIHLGTAQPPPVNDTTPPLAAITSPAPGASLAANTTIQVEASVSDDQGLASVELVWTYTGDAFPCPYSGQSVTCTESAGVYTWNVSVGVGSRRFQVRAVDLAGNTTNTPEQDVMLTTQPTTPPPNPTGPDLVAEDNDNAGQAFPTRCGTAIDLVVDVADEDWFSYNVAPGTIVSVGITAAPGATIGLELFDPSLAALADTADILGAGGSLSAAATGDTVLARISTTGTAVPYRLSAVCSTPETPPVTDPPVTDPPVTDPPVTDPPVVGNGQPYRANTRDLGGSCGCTTTAADGSGASGALVLLLVGGALTRRRR